MVEVSVAVDAGNYLGESPTWSVREQALWWINCEREPEIHRWTPATGEHQTWPMPRRVGGLALKPDGDALVAMADGVYDFSPETGEARLRAKSPFADPEVKLHEAHCDLQGRFWVGAFDHAYRPGNPSRRGAFCRLDGDVLVPVIEDIDVANGLAFSPSGDRMYFAASGTRTVRTCSLDPATGEVSDIRPFLVLDESDGFIDGATIDAEGCYWLATVGVGTLRRYRADGSLDRVLPMPFGAPTKPGFGGADMATLFVTSTQMQMPRRSEASLPDGPVYALDVGVAGVPDALFAG